MLSSPVFQQSDALEVELRRVFGVPRYDDTHRLQVSYLACSLSIEHWTAMRRLLQVGLLPSGLVVHRAQYEAAVRGIWALYAAPDTQVEKLASILSTESEQASKNLPQVAEMLGSLALKAPSEPVVMMGRFKETSWKALNSYVHAGIHPLQRHSKGYPVQLIEQMTRNANGLAVIATIHAAVLTGRQDVVASVYALQYGFIDCLPPRTDGKGPS